MAGIMRKFITGTIWLSAAQFISFFLSFGVNIILARLLTPKDFGTFFLALSITDLFYILSSWSFSIAIIQAKEVNQEFLDTAYWLSLIQGFIMFSLTLIVSFLLKRFYSFQVVNIIVILSALKIPTLLSACYGAIVERELEYRSFSLVQLLSRIIPMFSAIGLAVLKLGVWSFVGREILTSGITFWGMRYISMWRFRWGFKIESAKHLLRFGSQAFVYRGLTVIYTRFRNFIIGTIAGTTQLGFFNQACQLSEMGVRLGGPAVVHVALAGYSRLQGNKDKLSQGYEMVNYFLIRFLIPTAILFFLFSNQIIVFLYGERWSHSASVLKILAFYALAMPIFENMKQLLYSQDRIIQAVKARVIQVAILVPGTYWALKKYGILGASYVVDLTTAAGIAIIIFYLKQIINLNVKKLIFTPLLSGVVTLIICWLWTNFVYKPKANLPGIFIIGLIILSTYFIVLTMLEKDVLWFNLKKVFHILKAA